MSRSLARSLYSSPSAEIQFFPIYKYALTSAADKRSRTYTYKFLRLSVCLYVCALVFFYDCFFRRVHASAALYIYIYLLICAQLSFLIAMSLQAADIDKVGKY